MSHSVSESGKDELLATRLIDLCPDGVIGVDASGTINTFNRKAVSMTGRAADTVLGAMHIREIYGSLAKAKAVKAAIYDSAYGGAGCLEGYETEIVDVNGDVTPIRLSATLIMNGTKEIGSVGFTLVSVAVHLVGHRRAGQTTGHSLTPSLMLSPITLNERHFCQTGLISIKSQLP